MATKQQIPEFTQSFILEHVEEISYLRELLLNASTSALFTLSDYRRLEERLAARLEALHVYGQDAVTLCLPLLTGSKPAELYAAASVVFELGTSEEMLTMARMFGSVSSELRPALVATLVQRSPDAVIQDLLTGRDRGEAPALAIDRAIVAAFRQTSAFERIFPAAALRDSDPGLRLAAWKALRFSSASARAEQTLAGALDDLPAVRRLALETAAWAGQGWVLDHCRRAAAKPALEHADELWLLAVLATEKDAATVRGLAGISGLGALRYELLGTLGQAEGVPLLIEGMTQPDALSASAAGAAFTRITGRVLRVASKAVLPQKEGSAPDDFEKEFLDVVDLPDAKEAADFWEKHGAKFLPGRRYSQGLLMPEAPPFSVELDLVSIREACLRAAFQAKPGPKAVEFERFPVSL